MNPATPARHFQKTLFAGVLVIVPAIITVFVLQFLFKLVDGILAPWIWLAIKAFLPSAPKVPGMGIVATLLIVYLAGVLATNVIGKSMLSRVEGLFTRLPLVSGIYSAVKQLTDAVAKADSQSFQKVIFVEFPAQGSWTLGFVTGSLKDVDGVEYYTVFVPTTPNPTTGFCFVVHRERIILTAMTIEDGFKFLMSAGVVQPPSLANERLPIPLPDLEAGRRKVSAPGN